MELLKTRPHAKITAYLPETPEKKNHADILDKGKNSSTNNFLRPFRLFLISGPWVSAVERHMYLCIDADMTENRAEIRRIS